MKKATEQDIETSTAHLLSRRLGEQSSPSIKPGKKIEHGDVEVGE